MDPRIREHAEVIGDHSTSIEPGDTVSVSAPPAAEDLLVALYEVIGERGANPSASMSSTRAMRAFMRANEPDDFELPAHSMAAAEETDVFIQIKGSANARETSDVAPEKSVAYGAAMKPIGDESMSKRWCLTQFPAPASAQNAEMSTEAYEEFVYDAVLRDWDAQREHQAQLVEILDPAEEVRIKSGDTTDLRLSIDGMVTQNDFGEHNLPGGEVFTAPVPDSVEGEVLFDKPVLARGREISGASLSFEGGEVVSHSATENEEVLTAILETDEGARRLGELGIGMNRGIDRFTHNMTFDEKMGDTVHLAIGRAYEDTVGEDREGNDSATHTDMIVDMSEDSFIEVDGEIVQENGTFVFEEGF